MERQPFKRTDRVSDQIRQIVSAAIFEKAHHLGLENITITGADVSPDLRQSKIYFRLIDPTKLVESKRALGKASSFLRKELARNLKTRTSPALVFVYDESIDQGSRIEFLLSKVRSQSPSPDEE